MHALTPLGGAVLGLLNEQPRSGYDLRRVFAATPMGHFSDSPGAIYPALRRLRAAHLVESVVEARDTLRPREVFKPTPAGLAALRAWATAPPTRDDMIAGADRIILRFVLTFSCAGPDAARRFLDQFEAALVSYADEVREFYRTAAPAMHLGARLGLEDGIHVFDAHIRWCRSARRALGRGPKSVAKAKRRGRR